MRQSSTGALDVVASVYPDVGGSSGRRELNREAAEARAARNRGQRRLRSRCLCCPSPLKTRARPAQEKHGDSVLPRRGVG